MNRTSEKWLVVAALLAAVMAGALIGRTWVQPSAFAEAPLAGYSDGQVVVVPVQTGRDSYGLAMADMRAERLWVYEIEPRGPARKRLRLLAARNWHHDKLLDEYNTAEPTPAQVKEMVEKLGDNRKAQVGENLDELFDVEKMEAPNR